MRNLTIIALILLGGVMCGQPVSQLKILKDTTDVLRTDLNSLSSTVDVINDTVTSLRTDVNANSTTLGTKLSLSGGTMTGNLSFGDALRTYWGDGNNLWIRYTDADGAEISSSYGLELNSTEDLNFSIGATPRWKINSTSYALEPLTNGTYNIGADLIRIGALYGNSVDLADSIILGNARIGESELEILDGSTVTTSELNTLSGLTATTNELNILTSAIISTSELNYLDNATSNIQNQLDSKLDATSVANEIKDSINADIRFFGTTLQYPTNSESVVVFRAPYEIEIDSVFAVVSGTTACSLKVNIRWGTDRLTTDAELFYGDQWISSTTGENMNGDTYSTIVRQGDWVRLETSGLVGTVYDANLTISYKKR